MITDDSNVIVQIDCLIKFIKTHPDAILPSKAHHDDNCWDVYAVEDVVINGSTGCNDCEDCSGFGCGVCEGSVGVSVGYGVVKTGLKVAYITPGFGFVFRPRSGLGFKYGLQPHLGEIDGGFRGELSVKMYNFSADDYLVKKGDRICQIKVEKIYNTSISFTEELVESTRGEGKFGSSGK